MAVLAGVGVGACRDAIHTLTSLRSTLPCLWPPSAALQGRFLGAGCCTICKRTRRARAMPTWPHPPAPPRVLSPAAQGGREVRRSEVRSSGVKRFPGLLSESWNRLAKLSATRLHHQDCGLGSLSKTPPGDTQNPSHPGTGCWVFLLQGNQSFWRASDNLGAVHT